MPRMSEKTAKHSLIKLLLTGDGKAGKTHYAAAAAEAGFTLLFRDGDVATPTINQFPLEARERIYLMSMHDKIDLGMRDSNFADSIYSFFNTAKFRWNDDQNRAAKRTDTEDTIWQVEAAKMNHNCILVIDSWTSFVESLMLKVARECSVDLANATQPQMRPVYFGAANRATAILQIIRSVPCHVLVIAHTDEYSHKVAPEGRRVGDVNEKDLEIAWTKLIPKSTSKPHGLLLPKYFTDAAWLTLSPSGRRQVDFKPNPDRVGGGHFTGCKSVDEYSFANLVKEIGGADPDPNASVDSWLTIIPPGESAEAPAQVLDPAKAAPIKGLAGLGGIKKA